MTRITFNNVLQEINNPELFELDEADELAFYCIKQMMGISKDKWVMVDDNFPDSQKLVSNQGFFGTSILLDRSILEKFSQKIRSDLKKLIVNFIVGQNLNKHINSWGFAPGGSDTGIMDVNILFTAKASMVDIKRELTRTLVHELNHIYDNADFSNQNKDKKAILRNNAFNKMVSDIQMSKDKIMQFIKMKNISLDQNYLEFIDWIFDFNEIKSLSKEIISDMTYKSIPFNDPENNIRVKNVIMNYLIKRTVPDNANKINALLTRGIVKTAMKYIVQMIAIYNQRLHQGQ